MVRTYERKTERAAWSQEQLQNACEAVNSGSMKLWVAAKSFEIPYKTLKRRLETSNFVKGSPGPSGCLGTENEKNLVEYIQRLQKAGFPPNGADIRRLAFSFAEKNGISHRFNKENKIAGYDWLQLFLKRNPEVAVRIPEHAFAISDNMKENDNQEVNALLTTASTSSSGANMAVALTSSSSANTSFEEIRPIPRLQKPKQTGRKKQTAEVLTTVEKRVALKRKAALPTKKRGKVQQKKKRKQTSSSATSAPDNLVMTSGESDIEEEDDDFCIECRGYFYDRKGPKCDWLQCKTYKKWLHEICSKDN